MKVRLALPKGRLQGDISRLLADGGLALENYEEGSRSYRPKATGFPHLFTKVFQEKDIPVQVAIGNYDLGICGMDWVDEHLVRFPNSSITRLRELGVGSRELWVVASADSEFTSMERLAEVSARRVISIVSEYANLAEAFVFDNRLRQFRVFPVWGAAEAYLPEKADLALVANGHRKELQKKRLRAVARLMPAQAVLIANRESFATEDLSPFLAVVNRAEVARGG